MKKALSLVLAALLLTALMVVGVSAGDLQEGVAVYGTPTIDGKTDEWANVPAYTVDRLKTGTATTITAQFRVMWDESHLYTLVEVKDPDHSFNGGPSVGDGCEVYVDLNNDKSGSFELETQAYTAVCANDQSYLTFDGNSVGVSYLEWGTVCAIEETADGYNYEFTMDTATDFEVALTEGKVIGFDIQVNDQNENADARTAAYGWCDDTDMAWQSPASYGNITLTKDGSAAPAAAASGAVNYALNAPVIVSGLESADTNLGEAAVDGDMATRWSSDYVDDSYITIDLGSPKPIGYMEIHWEAAYAVDYTVETGSASADELEHTVATVTGNTELDNVLTFDTVTARYVTIRTSKRATEWGNSIYEIVIRKSADETAKAATEGYPSSGYTPKAGSSIIDGERIGLEEGWGGNAAAGCKAAFDGDVTTFFDPLGTGDGWAGMDAGQPYTLTAILIHPRDGQLARFNGGTIEGSNDPDFADATAIFFSVEEASEFEWITIEDSDFDDNGAFRYFRYINYTTHGDVGDIELYGYPSDAAPAASTASAGEPTMLWDFNGDELMSDNMGANSNGGVMFYGEEDYYTFMATGNDPYVSIDIPVDSVEDIWWAKIRVHNNSPATAVELFGATSGRSLSGPECTHFEIDSNSDEWKTYIIYIPDENVKTANAYKGQALEETYWEGNVDWIRLDPMWHEGDDGSDNGGSCESGDEIQIDYIAFFSNEADAKAFRADQDTPVKYVAPAKAEEPAAEEAPNPIEEAAEAVAETASEAVEAVEEAASDAVEAVEEVASDAAEAVSDAVEEVKSGCGSVIGGGLIVLVTILGCGWMTSRKH